MIRTASALESPSMPVGYSTAQHTVLQTVLLHLLPGALITIAFIVLGPWVRANHLPPVLAILLPILFVLIPFELGFLYFLGYRRNGRLSLEGIVLYREPQPVRNYFIFPLLLLVWFLVTFPALASLDDMILTHLFGWLPAWFQFGRFSAAEYSQGTLSLTFALYLALNGLFGPMVEELYFRGYLLPRMEYMKGWAGLFNAVLFSLYHFFNPWQNITRIVALIPMTYTVRWKKNLYLGMLAHCMLNIIFTLLTIPSYFK